MKKIVSLVLLAALLGVADIGGRSFAEAELAAKVERSVKGSSGVDADISSFPFLGRLLVSGEVPRLDVRVRSLSGTSLEVTHTLLRLDGVVLDRSELVKGRAEVKDIERGTVEMTIEAAALAALVPDEVDLTVRDGRLVAAFRGIEVSAATLDIDEEGALRLQIPPLPAVRIVLPGSTLFPCRPDAELVNDEVRLRCAFEDVPPALVRAANELG